MLLIGHKRLSGKTTNHQFCPSRQNDNNSHDTASSSATGVTSLERVGVTTLTVVVGTLVDNERSANDGLRAEEGDELV